MSSQFKSSIGSRILLYLPLLLLFISVFNEFDFNYLSYEYFSFNFPFILIFYWSLKKPENLGYGLIFFAGVNPLGLFLWASSLASFLAFISAVFLAINSL